jgi:hypothetical protein
MIGAGTCQAPPSRVDARERAPHFWPETSLPPANRLSGGGFGERRSPVTRTASWPRNQGRDRQTTIPFRVRSDNRNISFRERSGDTINPQDAYAVSPYGSRIGEVRILSPTPAMIIVGVTTSPPVM